MEKLSTDDLVLRIEELENRLAEAEQLIEAIKAGEVDAFAFTNNNQPQVFTLQSGDYAYRVLVENFNEGALNLSEDGLIVYTNTYFTDLLKLPYEKVIGTSFTELVHPSSREIFNDLFKKGLAGKSKGEIILVAAETSYPVYVSLTSLYPTLQTVGMIVTDLSEKKDHERKIEQKNLELQRINKELEAFTYVSSHDLQEPLRKIQMFAGRIMDQEKDSLSDTSKDYFGRMTNAASRMQTLIQDLLNFSRLTTTERKFSYVNLKSLAEEVISEFRDVIDSNNVTIEVGDLCSVNIIPFQFQQLLHNLINNAIRFARRDTPSRITINSKIVEGRDIPNGMLSANQKYCQISVADNGIGFEQRYSDKIFDVFQRLHTKEQYSGTGIGLAIVKKIVANHNGFISAKGELNKGATFDIFLPA